MRCRCATTAAGWSTPARCGLPRPVPDAAATLRGRRTCGCSPRCRASTGRPSGCWPTTRRASTTRRSASSSTRGGFSPLLPHALHGAARRLRVVVRPGRRAGVPRALPVQLPRPPRHARASSARPSGAPSPAARASTSRGRRRAFPTCAPAPRSPRCVETADGVGDHRRQRATPTVRRRGRRRPTPARRWRCWPSPTAAQREVLGAMPLLAATPPCCTPTPRVLPRHRRARASWNYLRRPCGARPATVTVSYDMTRLQRPRRTADGTTFIVTLGGQDLVDPATVHRPMEYEHPIYTPESVAAQRRLPELDTDADRLRRAPTTAGASTRTAPAPASQAAARARRDLGRPRRPPRAGRRRPRRPADAYATTIRHTRRDARSRARFTHRSTWLVDLDDLPDHGAACWHASRRATTSAHPDRHAARQNVDAFLAAHGDRARRRPRPDGRQRPRVRLLLQPDQRVLVPPTAAATLAGVVVEVHNTYGDRHAYLVHPDEQGRARTDKRSTSRPFHGTDG